MKVIQITDDDAKELVKDLELARHRHPMMTSSDMEGVPENKRDYLLGQMHRHFNFYVVQWLQKHGAKVTE